MNKSTKYQNHWKKFVLKHIVAGIVIGIIVTYCLNLHLTTIVLSTIIALSIALYRAFYQPCDLTDWQIYQLKGVITPKSSEQIEPDSYDVLLGTNFARIEGDEIVSWEANEVIINPNESLLAHTQENFKFPSNIKGTLQGKSSWARLSLFVECAGLFDKGFEGTAVLELYNASPNKIKIKAGDKIAQMSFHRTLHATIPYGSQGLESHYQGQEGAKSSWLTKNDRIIK